MATVNLTGDFIEIHIVANLDGTGETETLVASTLDDVEISDDVTVAEAKKHGSEQKTRRPVGFDHELTFAGLMVSDLQALKDLNLINTGASPPVIRGYSESDHEAIRLKVFENESSSSAAQEITCETARAMLDSLTWPTDGDFGTWEGTFHADGDIRGDTLQS